MRLNPEIPYIEYESDDLPYDLYEIHGVCKIKELSLQLRTFINTKAATIQYRFSPKTSSCLDGNKRRNKEIKEDFKTLASKFLQLLLTIKKNSASYEDELNYLVRRLIITEDKRDKSLITDLNNITEKLFTKIHVLSEQEIYLHPRLLKFMVKLIQEAFRVFKILNNWASEYYEELRINYAQLHEELNLLIPEIKTEMNTTDKNQLSEEGVKEW